MFLVNSPTCKELCFASKMLNFMKERGRDATFSVFT